MKNKITSREVKIFLLGFFTMFIILLIYDWKDFVKGVKEGYNSLSNSEVKK